MITRTKIGRALVLVLAAAVGAVGAVAFSEPSTSGAAAGTTNSYTVAGVDLHPLDQHVFAAFVPNSGGGAEAVFDQGTTVPSPRFLEARLELPIGAKVTSLQVYEKGCSPGAGSTGAVFSFGYYAPATGATMTNASLTANPSDCARRTLTKTGGPITTIAAGRRYVLDWTITDLGLHDGYGNPSDLDPIFYGATFKYTCTAPCAP